MAERDGAQNIPAVCALRKVTPDAARRSILGVTACLYPLGPTQSHKSSNAKNRMFGCCLAGSFGLYLVDAAFTVKDSNAININPVRFIAVILSSVIISTHL